MTVIDEHVAQARLRVLDHTGDTTIEWSPANAVEVEIARQAFVTAKGKGYMAYRVEDGGRGTQLHAFDPSAGEIVMSPAIVGG